MDSYAKEIQIQWSKGTQSMIVARIEFKPGYAPDFSDASHPSRTIIEKKYLSPEDLIVEMKELEDIIQDCVAVINGRMICLSTFKTT